jgi:hypothetical protein
VPSDAEGSFRTHANYLRAFATLAGFPSFPNVPPGRAVARQKAQILRSPTLSVTKATINRAALKRSLSNAWGTELILALTREYATEDELLRLANNWGAVQTYYVGYHAFQAFLIAFGQARPESHPKTQRMFADRWARPGLDMPPWTFAAQEGTFRNGPTGRPINAGLHPWSACDTSTCWDIAAKALRSTREDAIPVATRSKREQKRKDNRRAWEDEQRERERLGLRRRREPTFRLPQLTVAEKLAVRRRVRPFTPLDYLYRLRIKSNYEDATMFTDGPTNETESRRVHRDLVRLAASVSFLHELHIREAIGIPAMTRLVDTWLATTMPTGLTLGLALRRDLLLAP